MSNTYYKSSYVTDDEDSRGTVIDINETPQLGFFSYTQVTGNTPRLKTLSPCTPPPLTPICEINSLRAGIDINNQHQTPVPALKRIERSGTHSIQIASSGQNVDNATRTKEWTIQKNGKLYKISIPHNVLPILNESGGSVSINVPGVGPVMLKINPHFKDPTASELQPFSLNFDEIMKTASEPSHSIIPQHIPESKNLLDLMFDPRFCWIQPKYKHYADSFKYNFNGFSKADMQKARRCLRNFSFGIKKIETMLEGKRELGKKNSKNTHKNVKETHNTYIPMEDYSNFNEIICASEDILTPKVIINTFENLDELEDMKNQMTKLKDLSPCRVVKKNGKKIYIKPCFVKLLREKSIDNIVNLYNAQSLATLKSRVIFKSASKLSLQQKLQLFNYKLISNEQMFMTTFTLFSKPLLIVNDLNFSNINFASESDKYDIVYSVDLSKNFTAKVIKDNTFVNAVRGDKVKLVNCDLLVRFLKGELGSSIVTG